MVEPIGNTPDFYLSSDEPNTWDEVRKCFVLGKLSGPRPTGYWLVRVDPPVPLVGRPDSTQMVLAERWVGQDISHMTDEPIRGNVYGILNSKSVREGVVRKEDLVVVAWGWVAKRPDLLPTE